MNPKGITEATKRLATARSALATMESAAEAGSFGLENFETGWWAFLLAVAGVYAKLEQGARGNPRAEGWFGRVKHIRKSDELLSYIHQARNSEEHGLEPTTRTRGMDFEPAAGVKVVRDAEGEATGLEVPRGWPAGEPFATVIKPGLRLRVVVNEKFGDTFPVPTTHLGNSVPDQLPTTVARLAVDYLSALIEEAAGYVV